jgi:hypothetical protein
VISLILFHFLERHKIEQLVGCTLQRVALRGRVMINQQKCRWVLVLEGTYSTTFLRKVEEEAGCLVL